MNLNISKYVSNFYKLHPKYANMIIMKDKIWIGFPKGFSSKWIKLFQDYRKNNPNPPSNGNGC